MRVLAMVGLVAAPLAMNAPAAHAVPTVVDPAFGAYVCAHPDQNFAGYHKVYAKYDYAKRLGAAQGTSGRDILIGTAYDDVLNGQGGADIICGRGGGDIVYAHGWEYIDGGSHGYFDFDEVSFYGQSHDVQVDLAKASTGANMHVALAAGETTGTIRNVQDLEGGNGNDLLAGDDNDSRLFGLAGDDVLLGRGGSDTLEGGSGTDWLAVGAGSDSIDAGGNPAKGPGDLCTNDEMDRPVRNCERFHL